MKTRVTYSIDNTTSLIMVIRPHIDHLRQCCEKAHHSPLSTHPRADSPAAKDDGSEHNISRHENSKIKQDSNIDSVSTETDPKNNMPNISRQEPVELNLRWPLPPSEIHDARLFKKVG